MLLNPEGPPAPAPGVPKAWAPTALPAPVPLHELRGPLARLSCVLPCWNEKANLLQLLPQLRAVLAQLSQHWEIVVVDDGSTDGTVQALEPWLSWATGVRLVQLSRNFGKEAAITAGMQAAQGDAVILMDADLQHPPSMLPTLVQRWRQGADMVYTVRQNREDESALKRWGAKAFYKLVNGTERYELPAGASDFRLMDQQVVRAILALPERNRFMKGLYAWVGFEAVAVPYQPAARAHGKSSFGLWRLLRFSADGLTAFTNWPLRAVSFMGLLLALGGFSYGAYLTWMYWVSGNPVSGWTTIVVALLLFSGVQLISLGVVGEYIGRIFEEVKRRPLYVVKRESGEGCAMQPPASFMQDDVAALSRPKRPIAG